jgi:hypothetical protein
MIFLPRTRPLELTAKNVRALRPSLNTPVVAMAELPVGPACAAILVHVEAGRGLQISVGVRALSGAGVALYGFDGPIGASVVGVALDAALSFAEGMGFLFDDDVVGEDAASREKAVLRWQELIGDGVPAARTEPARQSSEQLFEPDGGELTDPPAGDEYDSEPTDEGLAAFDMSGTDSARAAAASFSPPAPAAGPSLSKFRVQPAVAEAPAPAAAESGDEPAPRAARRRAAFGKVRLMKRRPGESMEEARRAWLLRLLTSF